MPRDFFHGRHAGLLVPLFSIPSRESWGIGEIGDLPRLGAWMAEAGFSFVQLLPINEMADGQNSPYSAMSAMAIDPIFIAPSAVPDVQRSAAKRCCRRRSARARAGARVAGDRLPAVRAVKMLALRAGFEHFREQEWKPDTGRARRLKAFIERARWWLDDYALFRALHARAPDAPGRSGTRRFATASRRALARRARSSPTRSCSTPTCSGSPPTSGPQAREACEIGVFGDFPFMVSGDSADVWARQQDFRLDASVGAPPDAFSETGQDWGFPAYRWDTIAAGGYGWLAARARRSAELYDGYRVDHLVGFFRTYVREATAQAGVRAAGRARSDGPGRSGAQRPQRAPARASSPRISA